MQKPNLTTRKFYGKWLYKVTLNIPGVSIFRMHNLKNIQFLDFEAQKNPYSTFNKACANKEVIIELATFLDSLDKDAWGKRIESNLIDLYTNDVSLYSALVQKFDSAVKSIHEPNLENLDILENSGSVVVKKLPHNKYQFKAFLLPHKIKNVEDKRAYLDWIDMQGGRILISPIVKDWFIKTEYNWDRRYVLVEDSQTLLLLKLRNSEALGRIYDYVISDK